MASHPSQQVDQKSSRKKTRKKTRNDFIFFWSNSSPYSQWYKSAFTSKSTVQPDRKEQRFNCAEQYMMSEKALLFNDMDSYGAIMATANPRKQKSLGRGVRGFTNEKWVEARMDIVTQASYAKFSQNESLKQMIIETKDRELVEASPHDKVWGVGLAEDNDSIVNPAKWRGLNLLGKALMKARERIVAEQSS
jgi:ribA/ribD-fused uncharacterized protein